MPETRAESPENHHAEGCDNPGYEGFDADGRPVLSWECWEVWGAAMNAHALTAITTREPEEKITRGVDRVLRSDSIRVGRARPATKRSLEKEIEDLQRTEGDLSLGDPHRGRNFDPLRFAFKRRNRIEADDGSTTG